MSTAPDSLPEDRPTFADPLGAAKYAPTAAVLSMGAVAHSVLHLPKPGPLDEVAAPFARHVNVLTGKVEERSLDLLTRRYSGQPPEPEPVDGQPHLTLVDDSHAPANLVPVSETAATSVVPVAVLEHGVVDEPVRNASTPDDDAVVAAIAVLDDHEMLAASEVPDVDPPSLAEPVDTDGVPAPTEGTQDTTDDTTHDEITTGWVLVDDTHSADTDEQQEEDEMFRRRADKSEPTDTEDSPDEAPKPAGGARRAAEPVVRPDSAPTYGRPQTSMLQHVSFLD